MMRTFLMTTIAFSCTVGIWSAAYSQGSDSIRSATYATIVQTKTIRCGFVVAPPHVLKDPNTGKISGIIPDVLNTIGHNLGYKVNWVEEVGWETMVEGLRTNRYDAVCTAIWPSGVRAQYASFSIPLYFSGVDAYARANDNRFDGDLSKLNSSAARIATVDGEISQIISNQQFPRAQKVDLPQLSDVSQLLLLVDQRKADATFVENVTASSYMIANPGHIKSISGNRPLRVYANTIMFAKGSSALKELFDVAASELLTSGDMDVILKNNTAGKNVFYRVALPYRSE